MSPSGRSPQFATLETARELESKCVPQLILGSLLGALPFSYWPILLTVPEVFAKDRLTRPSSLLGEYRPGVTRSQVLTAYNVYRFISLCQDCFIFFSQYAGNAHGYNILMRPNKTYTNQKSVRYIILGNKQ